jgi:hypothetical protein
VDIGRSNVFKSALKSSQNRFEATRSGVARAAAEPALATPFAIS